MALFSWTDEYSVRIPQIDAQHKKLVGLINVLHEAMASGKGKEALAKILAELVDYTKVHFRLEEQLMQQRGYLDYLTHKAEHDRFIMQIQDFQLQFQASKLTLTIQVMNFLKDWLKNHILGADKKYISVLSSPKS